MTRRTCLRGRRERSDLALRLRSAGFSRSDPRGFHQIDGISHTDGLDAWSGPTGNYPEGALAIHDDTEEPLRGQQNYKIVDWREIKQPLQLP